MRNGSRCHAFVTASVTDAGTAGHARPRPRTGIVYQNNGSSRAPHWRLKWYVPDWTVERLKEKKKAGPLKLLDPQKGGDT